MRDGTEEPTIVGGNARMTGPSSTRGQKGDPSEPAGDPKEKRTPQNLHGVIDTRQRKGAPSLPAALKHSNQPEGKLSWEAVANKT